MRGVSSALLLVTMVVKIRQGKDKNYLKSLYNFEKIIIGKMATTKKTTIRTGINLRSDKSDNIPNSRLVKGKAPLGAAISDLLKPLWDANVKPRGKNEEIRKEAWQRN